MQPSQHMPWGVEARSSSGGATIAQKEELTMYDDQKQMGGGRIEVFELVTKVGQ